MGAATPNPDWVRREFRRAYVRALGLLVTTYALVVVGFVAVAGSGRAVPAWAVLTAIVSMAPLLAAFTWLMLRRRLVPGIQALRWSNGSADAAWKRLDEGEPPDDVDDALARLADRDDDDGVAMRASWLASARRTGELRDLLDGWTPTDPVNVARRERAASTLSYLEGVVDDLGQAWESATAIPNARDRIEQQAKVFIEDARRRTEAEDDPFPRLVEAHRLLGSRAAEFNTSEDARQMRQVRVRLVLGAVVPAAIFAVIGLTAWNGAFG